MSNKQYIGETYVTVRKLTAAARRSRILSYVFLLVMIFGSVGLDQASKFHSEETLMAWSHETDANLYKGHRYPLAAFGSNLPGDESKFYLSFAFNYVRNLGAAWGALSGLSVRSFSTSPFDRFFANPSGGVWEMRLRIFRLQLIFRCGVFREIVGHRDGILALTNNLSPKVLDCWNLQMPDLLP